MNECWSMNGFNEKHCRRDPCQCPSPRPFPHCAVAFLKGCHGRDGHRWCWHKWQVWSLAQFYSLHFSCKRNSSSIPHRGSLRLRKTFTDFNSTSAICVTNCQIMINYYKEWIWHSEHTCWLMARHRPIPRKDRRFERRCATPSLSHESVWWSPPPSWPSSDPNATVAFASPSD